MPCEKQFVLTHQTCWLIRFNIMAWNTAHFSSFADRRELIPCCYTIFRFSGLLFHLFLILNIPFKKVYHSQTANTKAAVVWYLLISWLLFHLINLAYKVSENTNHQRQHIQFLLHSTAPNWICKKADVKIQNAIHQFIYYKTSTQ